MSLHAFATAPSTPAARTRPVTARPSTHSLLPAPDRAASLGHRLSPAGPAPTSSLATDHGSTARADSLGHQLAGSGGAPMQLADDEKKVSKKQQKVQARVAGTQRSKQRKAQKSEFRSLGGHDIVGHTGGGGKSAKSHMKTMNTHKSRMSGKGFYAKKYQKKHK